MTKIDNSQNEVHDSLAGWNTYLRKSIKMTYESEWK